MSFLYYIFGLSKTRSKHLFKLKKTKKSKQNAEEYLIYVFSIEADIVIFCSIKLNDYANFLSKKRKTRKSTMNF